MISRIEAGIFFVVGLGAALPQFPPVAATPPPAVTAPPVSKAPAPVFKDETADLKRRLLKVEQENTQLKARLDLLTKQVESLTGSYLSHYHEVKGTVGNGLTTQDGKTLVTGSYIDNDLRRTTSPQPSYHPVYALPIKPLAAAKPPVKPTPKAAVKKPQ